MEDSSSDSVLLKTTSTPWSRIQRHHSPLPLPHSARFPAPPRFRRCTGSLRTDRNNSSACRSMLLDWRATSSHPSVLLDAHKGRGSRLFGHVPTHHPPNRQLLHCLKNPAPERARKGDRC